MIFLSQSIVVIEEKGIDYGMNADRNEIQLRLQEKYSNEQEQV